MLIVIDPSVLNRGPKNSVKLHLTTIISLIGLGYKMNEIERSEDDYSPADFVFWKNFLVKSIFKAQF